ncbi:transporter family protein [Sporomusaceae bacterium BoRhaA]|uniref:EamA family transporter n=1 Tax=Pelorhabdus rhamnosifermentans TaxID=2772457 RepID=UPI001C06170C|nr:EamA family transporter [Pelorhabdus rhamnosifermentans]MBU2702224.1 transporter family protein [Pelorhabdus rhamnosifermentans]
MDHLWLVYALLSALTASLVGIFGKIGLQSVDANTATAIRSVIMAVFLLIVIACQGNLRQIPHVLTDTKAFTFIVLSGVAGALSWLFYFLALKYGKVTQVAPIDKLSVVMAAILAMIFLGERVSILGGTGITLIGIGAILVAFS